MRIFGLEVVDHQRYSRLVEENTVYSRALEDVGWVNLSQDNNQRQIFPEGLKEVFRTCRKFYYLNPLAGHWVNLTNEFVFGEGVSAPKCAIDEVQNEINEFWNDPDNQLALTSYQAQVALCGKLQYAGNLFFALFTDDEGNVRVRLLDVEEVADIIRDDDDRMRTNFFKVVNNQHKYNFISDSYEFQHRGYIYYPDISNLDAAAYNIPKGKIMDAAIYHVKINCDINDKFGIPELSRGIDWIRAHKDMAGDLATLVRSLTTLAWKKKVKGGPAQVSALKNVFQAKTDLSNRRAAAGSTQYENEAVDTTPISTPTGGAVIGEKGLRQIKLMVCAASGIFEHYFGDPSTGNLATAYSMELPMVKKFSAYQKVWSGIFQNIIMHQVNKKIELGVLPALGSMEYDSKTRRNKFQYTEPIVLDCDFPPIVEKDPKILAEALKIAKDGNLIGDETAAQQFLSALRINNIDEEIGKIDFTRRPFVPSPFGSPEPTPPAKPAPVKEDALGKPDVSYGARLAKKNKYVLSQMEAYRKTLGKAWNEFIKTIKKSGVADGEDGKVVGDIENLSDHLAEFRNSMLAAAKAHFPIAIDIGKKFTQSHLKKAAIKESLYEAARKGGDLLSEKLDWNEEFVTASLIPDIQKGIEKALKTSYKTKGDFFKSLEDSIVTFGPRVDQYVGAFWVVEEAAVKAAGEGTGLMVNFVGPDDSSTCEGCNEAVNGGPYPIEEAPEPGSHECRGNCRHALQIVEV